ncbi:hypothetical protein REPUB_Repub20aG0104800 [Reevesia pubescens]
MRVVQRLHVGDLFVLPAEVAGWIYNDGESDLVMVSISDELKQKFKRFLLAGNPQGQNSQHDRQSNDKFFLSSLDEETLAVSFGIDPKLAKKLQNFQEEEKRETELGKQGELHDSEESFWSMKLKHPTYSLFAEATYFPGGCLTIVNGLNLPILKFIQLSALREFFSKNAIHPSEKVYHEPIIMYITKGSGRIQLMGESGETIFDKWVEKGQILTIPKNVSMVKKAGNNGFEVVGFIKNAKPLNNITCISHIARHVSAIRSLPEDVLRYSYGISKDEAMRLNVSAIPYSFEI